MASKVQAKLIVAAAIVLVAGSVVFLILGPSGEDGTGKPGEKPGEQTELTPDLAEAKDIAQREKAAKDKRKELIRSVYGATPGLEALMAGVADSSKEAKLRLALVVEISEGKDMELAARSLVALLGRLALGDKEIREQVILALGRLVGSEKARAKLIERLKPRAPENERLRAIDAMMMRPGKWARPYIKTLIDDGNKRVREEAEEALRIIDQAAGGAKKSG